MPAFLVLACNNNSIGSIVSSSQLLDSSSIESSISETSSSISSIESSSESESIEESSSEISSSDELDGFHELADGLYVNYLPGIYESELLLTFKITNPNSKLYYTMDYDLFDDNNLSEYSNPIRLNQINSNNLDDYPLTTSVDGILADDTGGRCISYNYINNIQKTGNYILSPKQNVIGIKYIDTASSETILSRSLTYIIQNNAYDYFKIPVVSLSMGYDEYFGENGFYNQIREEIEKRVNLEYFDLTYGEYFYRNSQIKLGGNWSLGYPQRTLNLNFNKNEFGKKNKPVTEHVFKERTKRGIKEERLDSLVRFRLHNGGNCFEDYTGINDAVLQTLMEDSNISTTGYRPCITYLNGEYWGIYSIREHYKDVYFEKNYGVNKDDVVLYELKGDFIFDDGDEKNAPQLLEQLQSYLSNDFTNDDVYETFINEYIDVDSLIDLFIAESWAGNWDFAGNFNNLKMWRVSNIDPSNPYSDGRWRFALHDADFAFTDHEMFLDKNHQYSYSKLPLFGSLMKNAKFRLRFLNRAEYLLNNNLSTVNASRVLDKLIDELLPYKLESAYRWGQTDAFYDTWMGHVNNTYEFFKYRGENYLFDLNRVLDSYN